MEIALQYRFPGFSLTRFLQNSPQYFTFHNIQIGQYSQQIGPDDANDQNHEMGPLVTILTVGSKQ